VQTSFEEKEFEAEKSPVTPAPQGHTARHRQENRVHSYCSFQGAMYVLILGEQERIPVPK